MVVDTAEEHAVAPPGVRSRVAGWLRPADQPVWCRPVLLAVAALAGLTYAWRMNGDGLEPYYAAAVRSMSGNWHDFVYGAFDPDGTISLDKLPGAFWPQALSVRLFGLHVWAIVLPQVVEGVLTVGVLYRAVRRLSGPVPGLVAATVLAISPATALLNRGNIADSLLILFLVLAADATAAAVRSGRLTPLLLAAVWVGLGFQAKMAQSWLVLPALAVPYAVAAPVPWRRRLVRLAAAGALTVAVSLSFMLLVTATPAADRPYADGSAHNSVFEQVFAYNAVDRFDPDNPLQRMAAAQQGAVPPAIRADVAAMFSRPGPDRLLTGQYGRDAGWLLPLALVAFVGLLLARRRAGRTDPERAAVLMWGLWLVTFAAVFSTARMLQPYYLGVLSPAVGALVGLGAAAVWRAGRLARAGAGALAAATVAYQFALVPASGTGRPGWLVPALVAAGVVALVAPVVVRWRRLGVPLAGAAVLLAPAVATGSVTAATLGPFDTPYQPAYYTAYTGLVAEAPARVRDQTVPALERVRGGAKYLAATSNGLLAADIIYVSGEEVLPIGGFTGTFPPPGVDRLRSIVAAGQVHLVIAVGADDDPRIRWVAAHCRTLRRQPTGVAEYWCLPRDAR